MSKQIRKMYDRTVKWKLQKPTDHEQALYNCDARSQVRLNPLALQEKGRTICPWLLQQKKGGTRV